MKPYSQLSKEELTALKKELEKQFEDVKGKGLKLDMIDFAVRDRSGFFFDLNRNPFAVQIELDLAAHLFCTEQLLGGLLPHLDGKGA